MHAGACQGRMVSWCTECSDLCFCLVFFVFFDIFLFPFLIVAKGIVKCRSYPESDELMSLSAMDGTEYFTVFV